ncbi:MAG TPA: hypothetical protein VMX36_13415, partial [Sedimentisphaerales bacterium]|nr:hypothetical protein [Sedimentisphaerales bacterium]
MFAYRHDILKAFIADGVKLVVLGPEESLSDLPEYKKMTAESIDHTARFMDYSPEVKLLVVDQENVLEDMDSPYATGCQVIRVFAKALYHLTGTRPVDPRWDSRGRSVQQYELRIRRMDIRFDEKLKETLKKSLEQLPPKDYETIRLCLSGKLSVKETAQRARISIPVFY